MILQGEHLHFDNGDVDISWASTRNDSILSIGILLINNRPGKPVSIDYIVNQDIGMSSMHLR